MVDLSDVIGKAVGGEEGKLINKVIDTIRRLMNEEFFTDMSDTDVVIAALIGFGDFMGSTLMLNPPPDDISTLRKILLKVEKVLMEVKQENESGMLR